MLHFQEKLFSACLSREKTLQRVETEREREKTSKLRVSYRTEWKKEGNASFCRRGQDISQFREWKRGSAANLAPTADAPWNREARANFPRAVAGLSGLSGRGGHLSKRDCGETDRSIILRSARLLFTQTSPPSFITGEEDGIEPSHEGF